MVDGSGPRPTGACSRAAGPGTHSRPAPRSSAGRAVAASCSPRRGAPLDTRHEGFKHDWVDGVAPSMHKWRRDQTGIWHSSMAQGVLNTVAQVSGRLWILQSVFVWRKDRKPPKSRRAATHGSPCPASRHTAAASAAVAAAGRAARCTCRAAGPHLHTSHLLFQLTHEAVCHLGHPCYTSKEALVRRGPATRR